MKAQQRIHLPIPLNPLISFTFLVVVGGCGGLTAEEQLLATQDSLWELQMERWPQSATYEGDRRFDDQLTDLSPEAELRYVQALEELAATAQTVDSDELSPTSQDTQALIVLQAVLARARLACHESWWSVDGLGGPQVDYPMMSVFHTITGQHDLETLHQRYLATEAQLDQIMDNLSEGLANGYSTPRVNLQRAIDQLNRYLDSSVDADPMLQLNIVDDTLEVDDSVIRDDVENIVRPALARYRDFLVDQILPEAREEVGVSALPNGDACYAILMEEHIGPGYTPETLHQLGLEQLEWAHAGMQEVAAELGWETNDVSEIIVRMREDSTQYVDQAAILLRLNSNVVERAEAALPETFGILPQIPIEVIAMEEHRATDSPAAYYYSAPEDRSRSAIYYVNAYLPETRPLFNLEALAFHEAIPGHHLQFAIAQDLADFHIWRRSTGQTAFVEGWALYAEVLADEMGLYSSPETRFGMYNYQAWRAARLVIDTGLHSMGWTRDEALQFLVENTSLPDSEAANEIDRYIAWPGQALAYMVGRLEIESLRRRAEATLADRFVLSDFHDQVLQNGAIPLSLLRENIDEWLLDETSQCGCSDE